MKAQKKNNPLLYASWFGVSNPFGSDSFTTVEGAAQKAQGLLSTAVNLSALVLVILLVYGGYTLITSAGDSDKEAQGMQIIQNAIVGMVIVFVARLAIMFVIDKFL